MTSRSRNDRPGGNGGFTLLEVLISIFLLVVIGAAIYQKTTETFKLRAVLSDESDFYNGVRLSMGILDRDLASLFSPILILPSASASPTPADLQQMQQLGTEVRASLFWNEPVDKTGIQPSHFLGTENRLVFVSASHIRLYKDAPESELAKIVYELEPDRGEDAQPDTRVLVKKEDPDVFGEDKGSFGESKTTHVYPLLHGIKALKFRFWRKDKEAWVTSWDNQSQDFKDMYPDIVEATVDVVGPSRLQFKGIYYFRPETPLRGINPST